MNTRNWTPIAGFSFNRQHFLSLSGSGAKIGVA
jgi:hypothetical protein